MKLHTKSNQTTLSQADFERIGSQFQENMENGKKVTDFFILISKNKSMTFVEKRSIKGRLYRLLNCIFYACAHRKFLSSNEEIKKQIAYIGSISNNNPVLDTLIKQMKTISTYISNKSIQKKEVEAQKASPILNDNANSIINKSIQKKKIQIEDFSAVLGVDLNKEEPSYAPYFRVIEAYIEEKKTRNQNTNSWEGLKEIIDNSIDLSSSSDSPNTLIKKIENSQKTVLMSRYKDELFLYQITKELNMRYSLDLFAPYTLSSGKKGSVLSIKNIQKEAILNPVFITLLQKITTEQRKSNDTYSIDHFLIKYLLPTLGKYSAIEEREKEELISHFTLPFTDISFRSFIQQSVGERECIEFTLFVLNKYKDYFESKLTLFLSLEEELEKERAIQEILELEAVLDNTVEELKLLGCQKEIDEYSLVLKKSEEIVTNYKANWLSDMDLCSIRQESLACKTIQASYNTKEESVYSFPIRDKKYESLENATREKLLGLIQEKLKCTIFSFIEKKRISCSLGGYSHNSIIGCTIAENLSYDFYDNETDDFLLKKGTKLDDPIVKVRLATDDKKFFKGPLSYQYAEFISENRSMHYLYNLRTLQVEFCLEKKETKSDMPSDSSVKYRFQTIHDSEPLYIAELDQHQKKDRFISYLGQFEDQNATIYLVNSQNQLQEIRFPRLNSHFAFVNEKWKWMGEYPLVQNLLDKKFLIPGTFLIEDEGDNLEKYLIYSNSTSKLYFGKKLYKEYEPDFEKIAGSFQSLSHDLIALDWIAPEECFLIAERFIDMGNRKLAQHFLGKYKDALNQKNATYPVNKVYAFLLKKIRREEIGWKQAFRKVIFETLKGYYKKQRSPIELTVEFEEAIIIMQNIATHYSKGKDLYSEKEKKWVLYNKERLMEISLTNKDTKIVGPIRSDISRGTHQAKKNPWGDNIHPKCDLSFAVDEYKKSCNGKKFPFDPLNATGVSTKEKVGVSQRSEAFFKQCIEDLDPYVTQSLYFMYLFCEDEIVRRVAGEGLQYRNIVS